MTGARRLRCAIYTRKSTEEGLEQEFNTLHAQREACEAYIKSQAGEGWELVPTRYDDGGFSGGNMDRPGIDALLADVDAGKVDVIVVYKVDRLTRSLMDFARIVERLDARSVSFVSVTQAFNTTTSMGRLTLNVLLSFAQFEREVTGERIRDKIAASKAKGIWMGGNVPLGYDLGDRRLIVNEEEAERVRFIYRRYLELKSVPKLVQDLAAAGICTKRTRSRRGKERGGQPFRTGGLYHLLQNRLYRGEITHKGKTFPGLHRAIVDRALYDAVQTGLAANRQRRRRHKSRAATCLFAGRIFDAEGNPMSPSFGYGRGGKRYRYYVSASILPGRSQTSAPEVNIVRRVPADDLEKLVQERISALGRSWSDLKEIVRRIDILESSIAIELDITAFGDNEGADVLARAGQCLSEGDTLERAGDTGARLVIGRRAVFRGGRCEANGAGHSRGAKAASDENANLLRQSHGLLSERNASPLEPECHGHAKAADYQRERRIMALGLLAPDIQRALLAGKLTHVDPEGLIGADLPLSWSRQRELLC